MKQDDAEQHVRICHGSKGVGANPTGTDRGGEGVGERRPSLGTPPTRGPAPTANARPDSITMQERTAQSAPTAAWTSPSGGDHNDVLSMSDVYR